MHMVKQNAVICCLDDLCYLDETRWLGSRGRASRRSDMATVTDERAAVGDAAWALQRRVC